MPAPIVIETLTAPEDVEALHRSTGIYSAEALAAVGLGLSPSHAYHTDQEHHHDYNQAHGDYVEEEHELRNHQPFRSSAQGGSAVPQTQQHQQLQQQTPSSTIASRSNNTNNRPRQPNNSSPITRQEYLEFQVLRAWELPDCLGGTNAYVVVKIPSFGQGKTQAIMNSNEPYFGSVLTIRSPLTAGHQVTTRGSIRSEVDDDELVNMADDDGSWTKVQVLVYNKNSSISDELIAVGEQDVGSLLQQSQSSPVIVELYDRDRHPCGCVELVVRRIQK